MIALAILALPPLDAQALLKDLRQAVAQKATGLRPYFELETNGNYLFRMANSGPALSVHIIPVPPGWKSAGKYWAIFSRPQGVEGLHDAVYEVTPNFKLGSEVPEWMDAGVCKPTDIRITSRLDAANHLATVKARITVEGSASADRALVFRLNENYRLLGAEEKTAQGKAKTNRVIATEDIPSPSEGDVVRAGGLIVHWTANPGSVFTFDYKGMPAGEDRFTDKLAYLTGWWVPSLSRLPAKTQVSVQGPKDWEIRSEGEKVSAMEDAPELSRDSILGSEKVVQFKCDIPISFPKIVAGKYTLAAEKTDDGGRTFRSWQFEPIDKNRAEFDVKRMAEAAKFYDQKLGKFPFPGYECFDGENYYGIESYSYTLLAPSITSRYVAHEMGHTYFGGIGPCTYIHDAWNEGLTTYVDDVLTDRNIDESFDTALAGIGDRRPLSTMNFDGGDTNAPYFRGASVMKMLEQEIGADKVLSGLKQILIDRRGKDTKWADLQACFEKVSKQKLDWFWNQWVLDGTFPTVTVQITPQKSPTADDPQREIMKVTLTQSGVKRPFRLRLPVIATNGELEYTKTVVFDTLSTTFDIVCYTPVRKVLIRPKDYALIRVVDADVPRS